MLMQPWIPRERMRGKALKIALRTLELQRSIRKELEDCINNYVFCQGALLWRMDEIPHLQVLVKAVLGIGDAEFNRYILNTDVNGLREMVAKKTAGLSLQEIDEVCHVLTKVGGADDGAC